MNYRMYSGGVKAGENVVDKISQDLKDKGYKVTNTKLDFIGFEAEPGTIIYLNNKDNKLVVPSNGKFITPYDGNRYLTISKFYFEEDYYGNIYYIM